MDTFVDSDRNIPEVLDVVGIHNNLQIAILVNDETFVDSGFTP